MMFSKLRKRILFASVVVFFGLSLPGLLRPGQGNTHREYPESWKFAVVSDTQGANRESADASGINGETVRAIAADIAGENPDFILVAGDLVKGWFRNGGTAYAVQYANWKDAMLPVYRAGIPVYPIRGNHDSGPERLALPPLPANLEPPPDTEAVLMEAFRAAFPESYIPENGPDGAKRLTYGFVHKNALVVGLDQYASGQHEVDQDWLDRQLAGSGGRHVFVYGHEPAYEAGHKDNLSFYPEKRDRFWTSLGKAGARTYFCGHDHFYDRALVPDGAGHGIRQIIAGPGGGTRKTWPGAHADEKVRGEYHDEDHYGYLLVSVEGPKATIAWKALVEESGVAAWKILDSFSYALE